MLLIVVGLDLYGGMFLSFFSGETQKMGADLVYSGLYTGMACSVAALVAPLAGHVLAVMSANEFQRIAIAFLALVSILQGIANQFGSAAAFIGITAPLRLLEGLVIGTSETAVTASIYRLFPRDEVGKAVSIMMGLRGVTASASVPLGAALYSGNGMAAPYLVIGSGNIMTVLIAHCFMKRTEPYGNATSTVVDLLYVWRLVAALLNSFYAFLVLNAVGVLARTLTVEPIERTTHDQTRRLLPSRWRARAEPWVGVEPFAFDAKEISTVMLVMTVSLLVSAVFFALPIIKFFGPVITVWISHVALIVGLALVGTPPVCFPFLDSAHPFAVSAVHCSFGLIGVGLGMSIPASMGVNMLSVADVGLEKEGVSAPLGVLTVGVSFIACTFSPSIATGLMDAIGVPLMGFIYACLGCCSFLLTLVAHSKFLLST